MDNLTTRVSSGVKVYWRRRRSGYHRLATTNVQGRKTETALNSDESNSNRRKRSWRINIKPKLKLKLRFLRFRFNPRKLLNGARDAYVRMMMRLANAPVISSGALGGYGGGIGEFGTKPVKEYDDKMIIEMYKSLAIKHPQLVAQLRL